MASTRKLPSGRYQGRYQDHGKRRTVKGTFRTKREALAAAVKAEGEAEKVSGVDLEFSEVVERWLEYRRSNGTSPGRMKDLVTLTNRLLPVFEGRAVRDLGPGDMDNAVQSLVSSGYSPNTVKQSMSCCRALFEWCERQGIVSVSPYKGVDLPKAAPLSERALAQEQVAEAVRIMADSFRPMMVTLAYTGIRLGECRGLHWSDVDFENNVIVVQRSYSTTLRVFKPVKGRRPRVVPMNGLLRQVLVQQMNRVSYPGVPNAGIPYVDVPVPESGLVFVNHRGWPFDQDVFRREFNVAFRAAGVSGPVRVHDLRHSYASWLAKSGLPMQDIQQLLGHSSVVTTERYSKYRIDDFSNVLSVLNGDSKAIERVQDSVIEAEVILDDEGEPVTLIEPDEDDYRESLTFGDAPD